ncbi:hypothetical protein PoB_003750400 [Plakobranchus ocellatus]|uniref:Uncharacterized protein n=1 Tax=Plakobranchus ocellatus TaxID=259542 RepID=A0AAV4AT72_9GAST|nr:hypothetical protein PoB_003750400 [Plakobranchus ocellatus]
MVKCILHKFTQSTGRCYNQGSGQYSATLLFQLALKLPLPSNDYCYRIKKLDKYVHEAQLRFSQENRKNWNSYKYCIKSQNHANFVPVKDFTESHLSDDFAHFYNKSDILDLIQLQAQLTVRLQSSYISLCRKQGDPFFQFRGSNISRSATGWVSNVIQDKDGRKCPCSDCTSLFTTECYYIIHVQTACHVVFNEDEAKATRVDVFYDTDIEDDFCTNGDSKRHNRRPCQLECVDIVNVDSVMDIATLKCVTHEEEIYHCLQSALAQIVRHTVKQAKQFKSPLRLSYPWGSLQSIRQGDQFIFPTKSRHSQSPMKNKKQLQRVRSKVSKFSGSFCPSPTLVAVVSHPHGLPKQITVGPLVGIFFKQILTTCKLISLFGNVRADVHNVKELNDIIKKLLVMLDSASHKEVPKCALQSSLSREAGKLSSDSKDTELDYIQKVNNCQYCETFGNGFSLSTLSVLKLLQCMNIRSFEKRSSDVQSVRKRNTEICSDGHSSDFFFSEVAGSSGQRNGHCGTCPNVHYCCVQSNQQLSETSKCKGDSPKSGASDDVYWQYSYCAPTCPGSSGAPVLILSPPTAKSGKPYTCRDFSIDETGNLRGIFHTHCCWKKGDNCSHRRKIIGARQDDIQMEDLAVPERQGIGLSHACNMSSVLHKELDSLPGKSLWQQDAEAVSNKSENFSFEADMDNIQIKVKFPWGETRLCEIYFSEYSVKEEKHRLFLQGNNYPGSADNYFLRLVYPPNIAKQPICLDDEKGILMYIEDMALDSTLEFVLKEAPNQDYEQFAGVEGVSLKN